MPKQLIADQISKRCFGNFEKILQIMYAVEFTEAGPYRFSRE